MRIYAKKTHCPQGHEYTEDNVRAYKNTRVCRICSAAHSKACHERDKREGVVHPSHTREHRRRWALSVLGWTPELFDKKLEEQGGKCAICPKVLNMEMIQNEARACADHMHVVPPVPRGVLCSTCNTMLGQAQDNPDILRAGAAYIEKFSSETAEVVKKR